MDSTTVWPTSGTAQIVYANWSGTLTYAGPTTAPSYVLKSTSGDALQGQLTASTSSGSGTTATGNASGSTATQDASTTSVAAGTGGLLTSSSLQLQGRDNAPRRKPWTPPRLPKVF